MSNRKHLTELWVGIDFDGTVVTHEYPDIGDDIGAIPWLQRIGDMDGVKLMLVTMRGGGQLEGLTAALGYLSNNGVKISAVNGHPTQHRWTSSPKPYCHIYVDDAALGVPLIHPENERPYVDWEAAGPMLIDQIVRMQNEKW